MAAIRRLRFPALPLNTIGFLSKRPFGSAAAIQYDYYYDDEEEEEKVIEACMPRGMTDCSKTERGVQWVMIGEPRANRRVFAERLSKLLEVPYISVGSLIRQDIYPRSTLHHKIANALDERKLVPEEFIFGLLSERLEEGYSRGETGFILDGIPRTRIQAEILDQIARVDLVVNFKCSEENMVKNNLGARKFTSCQDYCFISSSGTPSKQLQDEHFHVQNQAEEYKPLEDYYRRQKKLINFEVAGAPGETWQGLLAALHLEHVNAITYSRKLTA
ncbi:hypothetical protein RIF29_19582 [Crotalaria pallida]|uniref:adenylate kinase n=1 Tax=Crotalaria pallida TaxID=3830 RepID=A0AAN9IBJ3_CROPI